MKNLLLTLLILSSLSIQAQEGYKSMLQKSSPNVNFKSASDYPNRLPYITERRLALVLTAASYTSTSALPTTNHDADSVTKAFLTLGFDIILCKDGGKHDFDIALDMFKDKLAEGEYDVCVFYFSGHGTMSRDVQFCLPRDYTSSNKDLNAASDFKWRKDHSISVDQIVRIMRNADANHIIQSKFIFVDACSNFGKSEDAVWEPDCLNCAVDDINERLFLMNNTKGLSSLYSSKPGLKSVVGSSNSNSLFTNELLLRVILPNMSYNNLVDNLFESLQGTQTPNDQGTRTNKSFVFNPKLPQLKNKFKTTPANQQTLAVPIVATSPNTNVRKTNADSSSKILKPNTVPLTKVNQVENNKHIENSNNILKPDTSFKVKTYTKHGITIEYVEIPSGTFTKFGNLKAEERLIKDFGEPHRVAINQFNCGITEITFEQYDAFCEATGREKPNDEGWGRKKRPVINVSWEDAKAFCDYMGCRLLTELEWEYVCIADDSVHTLSLTTDQANFDDSKPYKKDCREKTLKVKSFNANEWGLFDIHGNVTEWCSDLWMDGPYHIIRGSGWPSKSNYSCSPTTWSICSVANSSVGFRVVCP